MTTINEQYGLEGIEAAPVLEKYLTAAEREVQLRKDFESLKCMVQSLSADLMSLRYNSQYQNVSPASMENFITDFLLSRVHVTASLNWSTQSVNVTTQVNVQASGFNRGGQYYHTSSIIPYSLSSVLSGVPTSHGGPYGTPVVNPGFTIVRSNTAGATY